MLFFVAAFVMFFDLVRPAALWFRHRRLAALRGTWEVEASEDELRWKTPDADARTSWSAFTRAFRQLALDGITAARSA